MKLGLVCYAENTGLGNQSLQYYEHLNPTRTMLLDRSGSAGHPFYPERYGRNVMIVQSLPEMSEVNHFIDGLDVVVFFEKTPTNYFIHACREAGVKTVVIPNFEYYTPHYEPHALHPDALIAPSLWRKDEYVDPVAYVPMPIINQPTEPPKAEFATRFLHVAGRPIHPDRNGTEIFLAALRLMEVPITATITCQDPEYVYRLTRDMRLPDNVTLDIRANDTRDWTLLYKQQDVLVMPRRFGGLCMPVNEALGFAIPVLMPDISPNNQWLPSNWLIPAEKTSDRKMGVNIDIFTADAEALAAKMTELANDTSAYRSAVRQADTLRHNYSWEALAGNYMRIFEQLCYH